MLIRSSTPHIIAPAPCSTIWMAGRDADSAEEILSRAKEVRERKCLEGFDEAAVEENLASIRRTLAAIDDLNDKWHSVQRQFAEALSVSLQTAFNVEAPCTLTDEEKHSVLDGAPTPEELCKRLKSGGYKNSLVMVGAGISVSAGIPDYRTPGTGLYHNLEKYNLPYPGAIFELDYFQQNPKPFLMLAKELYPGKFAPSPAHFFIKLLSDKGCLLRCYTQNFDTLERQTGLPIDKLVEAHGSFATARCINSSCNMEYSAEEVKATIFADEVPTCTACGATVKPGIVAFGEALPERFKKLHEQDCTECDLLIVMGTSLKVAPFSGLIHRVGSTVPRLLINRELVGTFTPASEGGYRDIVMLGECDTGVERVCELCGWREDLEKFVKPGAVTKVTSECHH